MHLVHAGRIGDWSARATHCFDRNRCIPRRLWHEAPDKGQQRQDNDRAQHQRKKGADQGAIEQLGDGLEGHQ